MKPYRRWNARVDDGGRLSLPPEAAAWLGLAPGMQIHVEEREDGLRLRISPHRLRRVYIEPTNACNLDCLTCMRNIWDEPPGWMERATFERLVDGLAGFHPTPEVFFGGFGEPLAHPEILKWVGEVKRLGAACEMITNGTLLDERRARCLVEAGLDTLWVSIDGASPECYADVRLGGALPEVIENIERLVSIRDAAFLNVPKIGIAFVAMKRNISSLPDVMRLARRLGADRVSVSNVLAHTPELHGEALYGHALYKGDSLVSPGSPQVSLPRLDASAEILAALGETLESGWRVELAGARLGEDIGRCPFVARGSLSVRWDGAVCPCLPLLHTHRAYLDQRVRQSHAYSTGSILERNLLEIWNDPVYMGLRERIDAFDFSPCVTCNSCEMAGENLEDCYSNGQPTCGGCLWAQGLIQCP